MMTSMAETMTQVGSAIAGLMMAYAMFQNYFPYELRGPITRYTQKFISFLSPNIHITFPEYHGDRWERSKAFLKIQRYLNKNSTKQAKRLQANVIRDSEAIVLTMADQEEVIDEYQGIKLRWESNMIPPSHKTISFYPQEDGKKFFKLTFHRRHRDFITENYLKHVLDQGEAITVNERRRKLYTNNKSESGYGNRRSMWSQVVFEHPATFDTLAMHPDKKQDIINDLINFSKSKDYYRKVGKAWKRGYLLFGPPGTGKSTMIAAMANLLKYDVYDLELTAVKDNTELRRLLIDTSSKAIIVIEDIDCSLDLTGQREKKKKDKEEEDEKTDGGIMEEKKKMDMEHENKKSEVTLSGLLNFIDGLWSACGGERIIVFTTNYLDKLDPALIRRGRMDKHIELSYCSFEAFKVLAKNYLDIDSHDLFANVEKLLEETNMTPADVAENLMPKWSGEEAGECLMRLIKAVEEAKTKAAGEEEEEKQKAAQKLAKKEKMKKKKKKELEEKSENGAEKLPPKEEEEEEEEEEETKKEDEKEKKKTENGDKDVANGVV